MNDLDDSDIFVGALYNEYADPSGFCFDILCNDEPIIDDDSSTDYNVNQRVSAKLIFNSCPRLIKLLHTPQIEAFVNFTKAQAAGYKTKNIILTMGEDFHYMNALMNFKNLDKLIK